MTGRVTAPSNEQMLLILVYTYLAGSWPARRGTAISDHDLGARQGGGVPGEAAARGQEPSEEQQRPGVPLLQPPKSEWERAVNTGVGRAAGPPARLYPHHPPSHCMYNTFTTDRSHHKGNMKTL